MHVSLALLDSDAFVIPDGCEVIDGEVVEKKTGTKSSWVGGQVAAKLGSFCGANRLGWVWPAGLAYRCFANRATARRPNASFIRHGRLPNEELPDGDIRIPADLAVEVVSLNDTVYELDERVEDYLAVGVRLVWVINPEARIAVIHRADGSMARVREGQELSGEDVVPGFRCLLSACLPRLPVQPAKGQGS